MSASFTDYFTDGGVHTPESSGSKMGESERFACRLNSFL